MRYLAFAAFAALLASGAYAQMADTCAAGAAEKKLSGAAKTSFMRKCEREAGAACTKQAADKKLSGAARKSFTTKCVKDKVG